MVERIIRDGAVVQDDWAQLRFPEEAIPQRKSGGKPVLFRLTGEQAVDDEYVAALSIPDGKVLLPLTVWLKRRDEFADRLDAGEIAVWLDSFEEPEALVDSLDGDLDRLPIIGINFPKFVDGRGYSIAHLLRRRYGYAGELRALGDVTRDQLFFLARCGFDSFALRADLNAEQALASLKDFSETYQTATDGRAPLFRHRAA